MILTYHSPLQTYLEVFILSLGNGSDASLTRRTFGGLQRSTSQSHVSPLGWLRALEYDVLAATCRGNRVGLTYKYFRRGGYDT